MLLRAGARDIMVKFNHGLDYRIKHQPNCGSTCRFGSFAELHLLQPQKVQRARRSVIFSSSTKVFLVYLEFQTSTKTMGRVLGTIGQEFNQIQCQGNSVLTYLSSLVFSIPVPVCSICLNHRGRAIFQFRS